MDEKRTAPPGVARRFFVLLLLAAFLSPLVHRHDDKHHPAALSGHHGEHPRSGRDVNHHPGNLLEDPDPASGGCGTPAEGLVWGGLPQDDPVHAHFQIDFLPRFRIDRIRIHPEETPIVVTWEIAATAVRRMDSTAEQTVSGADRPEIILYSSDLSPPAA